MFWRNFWNAAYELAYVSDKKYERPGSYTVHLWRAYLNNLNDKNVHFPLKRK